jgi:hypothetical protein
MLTIDGRCVMRLDMSGIHDDAPSSMITVSSRTSTPRLKRNASMPTLNSTRTLERTRPVLETVSNEFRLTDRNLDELNLLELSTKSNSLTTVHQCTDGFVNRAYSMDSFHHRHPTTNLSIVSSSKTNTSITSPSSLTTLSSARSSSTFALCENVRHMCSIIGILLRNTRYIFIVTANLFEGILIKGYCSNVFSFSITIESLSRIRTVHNEIFRISTSIGYINSNDNYWCHCTDLCHYWLSDRCLSN